MPPGPSDFPRLTSPFPPPGLIPCTIVEGPAVSPMPCRVPAGSLLPEWLSPNRLHLRTSFPTLGELSPRRGPSVTGPDSAGPGPSVAEGCPPQGPSGAQSPLPVRPPHSGSLELPGASFPPDEWPDPQVPELGPVSGALTLSPSRGVPSGQGLTAVGSISGLALA